ncbi:hypothetical protein DFS34DRAFT_598790 [Phlyctochytrium arcticum]|nr:hypothetical protein DFS34DRAFT_598790 [Phlyctochytrium arcticum]
MASTHPVLSQPVSTLLNSPRKALVSVSGDTTIEKTFQILAQEDLRAVPVWSDEKKTFTSIVDTLDLLSYTAFQPLFDDESKVEDPSEIVSRAEFLQHPVKNVIGQTAQSQAPGTIDENATLLDLAKLMSKGKHRVLVTTSGCSTPNMLTQTDLLRYLFSHNEQFDNLLSRPADQAMNVQLHSQSPTTTSSRGEDLNVATVSYTSSALAGFKHMKERGVRTLGVVDQDGALVAVLKASDLRGVTPARLPSVLQPTLAFLRSVHATLPPPPTCTTRFTLAQILAQLLLHNHRRLFVVDPASEKPVGVISMSDLCLMFAAEGGQQ